MAEVTTKKPKPINYIYPGETELALFKIAGLMLPHSLKCKSYGYLLTKSHLRSCYEITLFCANNAHPVYEAL